jgi:hypothetical protein
LGELIQLCRDGTVVDYQSKFLSLLARCDGLTEKHQIDVFTVGLCNPLKTDVELEHPAMLEEAMALDRAYEQRLSMTDLPPARSSPLPRPSPRRVLQLHGAILTRTFEDVPHERYLLVAAGW